MPVPTLRAAVSVRTALRTHGGGLFVSGLRGPPSIRHALMLSCARVYHVTVSLLSRHCVTIITPHCCRCIAGQAERRYHNTSQCTHKYYRAIQKLILCYSSPVVQHRFACLAGCMRAHPRSHPYRQRCLW